MSIANELSCDVAAAMLVHKNDQLGTDNTALTEIVLEFHSTLRRLTGEARQRRRFHSHSKSSSPPPSGSSSAASSGSH